MSLKKTFGDLQEKILQMLKERLPGELTYHSYGHTLDVMESAIRLAREEGIDEKELELLKTAAAMHDSGYLYTRHEHEEKSCEIARELMAEEGVGEKDIERVCDLILATKLPNHPKNKLEEIICDADLDYLGRDDYFTIAQRVFDEFLHFGTINSEKEWIGLQIRFLEAHRYYTPSANRLREAKKQENLMKIRERAALYPKKSTA